MIITASILAVVPLPFGIKRKYGPNKKNDALKYLCSQLLYYSFLSIDNR